MVIYCSVGRATPEGSLVALWQWRTVHRQVELVARPLCCYLHQYRLISFHIVSSDIGQLEHNRGIWKWWEHPIQTPSVRPWWKGMPNVLSFTTLGIDLCVPMARVSNMIDSCMCGSYNRQACCTSDIETFLFSSRCLKNTAVDRQLMSELYTINNMCTGISRGKGCPLVCWWNRIVNERFDGRSVWLEWCI